MQDYLPDAANSTKAITIMQENFDDTISNKVYKAYIKING